MNPRRPRKIMKASCQQYRRESGRSEVPGKPLGVWRTYSIWAFWVGIAFFGVYPACNWFTSQRSEHWNLFFNAELALPFYPEFVWVYMSMYLLFALPPFFLNVAQLRDLGRQLVDRPDGGVRIRQGAEAVAESDA